MSDRPVAEASTCNNTQDANIHANGGIRIRNTSKRSAADLRLRALGHWDRQGFDPRTVQPVARHIPAQDELGGYIQYYPGWSAVMRFKGPVSHTVSPSTGFFILQLANS